MFLSLSVWAGFGVTRSSPSISRRSSSQAFEWEADRTAVAGSVVSMLLQSFGGFLTSHNQPINCPLSAGVKWSLSGFHTGATAETDTPEKPLQPSYIDIEDALGLICKVVTSQMFYSDHRQMVVIVRQHVGTCL
ncbi:hypothetical protein AOLI_G00222430 [Acnodon oligacanthus]